MLNLLETLEIYNVYLSQSETIIKFIMYSFGTFACIDYLRDQIPEIPLLQLVPGLFLAILVNAYFYILIFSYFLTDTASGSDGESKLGTKTLFSLSYKLDLKSLIPLLFLGFIFLLNVIFPISFDSLSSVGDKTIDNNWPIEKFCSIEFGLTVLLILILQLPLLLSLPLYSEKFVQKLPFYQKDYIFVMSVVSGVLTPTIDVATQINFIIISVSLYNLVISLLKKYSIRILSS